MSYRGSLDAIAIYTHVATLVLKPFWLLEVFGRNMKRSYSLLPTMHLQQHLEWQSLFQSAETTHWVLSLGKHLSRKPF